MDGAIALNANATTISSATVHLTPFLTIIPRQPSTTLFPYTTLFRSSRGDGAGTSAQRGTSGATTGPGGRSAPAPAQRTRITTCERAAARSEEHTSELQSRRELVCRLLLEKKKWRRWTGRSR